MNQIEILAILLITIALAHWLGDKPGGRMVGGALMVILLAATLANLGVIPLASQGVPVYDQLLGTAAPVSIFLLLLKARLSSLARAGAPMLMLFAIAAAATVIGVLAAGWLLGAEQWMGQWYGPLSGMFAATYIGGGANFNALALHYEFMQSGNLYAAAAVADHVMTVVWIALLLVFPRLLGGILRAGGRADKPGSEDNGHAQDMLDLNAAEPKSGKPGLADLVVLAALGLAAFVASERISLWLFSSLGIQLPSILVLTTLALVLAQFDTVARLRGTQVLGMFGAYLFLAALAAYCEVAAIGETGWLGVRLLAFVVIAVAIHGVLVVTAGKIMNRSAEVVAVVSATTIGGSTVVLPLIERFGRRDLLLPGIVLGTLGNLLGTYIGFTLVYTLQ
ncbi:MAG: DUF819 family protein [Wenzhouxiangellaceae bacterium]|nr:DUF819 family protein [Wenzhouxiangellaceae bacterium]